MKSIFICNWNFNKPLFKNSSFCFSIINYLYDLAIKLTLQKKARILKGMIIWYLEMKKIFRNEEGEEDSHDI